MAKEIAVENERISNFQGLMTLTLTLHRVILHIVVHHSLISTCTPNFIEIEETFCGRKDVRTYGWTDRWTFETDFIRSTQRLDLKRNSCATCTTSYVYSMGFTGYMAVL